MQTSFQTGPIVVGDTMFVTTDFETIALDPATCRQKWRTRETYRPAGILNVNRGAAHLDGRVFRGTQDGRVLAYDAATGRRLWERSIANPALGETVPAALLAWNGLVFAGNAGGDNKGVKGRMYALDAATGAIVWEQYLVPRAATDVARGPAAPTPPVDLAGSWGNAADVPITGGATWTAYTLDPATGTLYVPGGNPAPDFTPRLRPGANLFANSVVALDARTGAYRAHYALVEEDFHDWDVSAAPALFTSRAGTRIMAAAVKDGYLYGHDLATGRRLYRTPVTTISNVDAPLTRTGTRFCPGTQGGTEWNGPAYSPATNLVYTGAVDWCATVRVADDATVRSVAAGQPWSGSADEKAVFGTFDPTSRWAGWLYASDAETGARRWRFRAPSPILSGVTPTAGGLVFFGDMGGRLYALDAETGARLWNADTAGAIGGGVVSYMAGGQQRVAVATGMTSAIWPTPRTNARIIVYSLP